MNAVVTSIHTPGPVHFWHSDRMLEHPDLVTCPWPQLQLSPVSQMPASCCWPLSDLPALGSLHSLWFLFLCLPTLSMAHGLISFPWHWYHTNLKFPGSVCLHLQLLHSLSLLYFSLFTSLTGTYFLIYFVYCLTPYTHLRVSFEVRAFQSSCFSYPSSG